MHSIPIDEEPLPETLVAPIGPHGRPAEVEVLGDLRGHVLAGRYVLTELLGSGELGCVYSGRDQASNHQVVVKVLASPEQRDVIARIAERARRRLGVRHPCVAAVLAEGTMGGLWYAVMEHAPGKNLYHAEDDPRFEGAGLLKLAAELAEGLATLHALGAPHGAISPGNLVWSDAGVKLVDLDVQAPNKLSEGIDEAGADVATLASVLLEVAGVDESQAPWVTPIARVVRGESRPSAAEWATQLRAAEIDALRPGVVDAAAHAEGVIDSAWDQLFEGAGVVVAKPSRPVGPIDTGLQRIEPPPNLAILSYEVEPELPTATAAPSRQSANPPRPRAPEPAQKDEDEGLSATSLTSLRALVDELEPETAPRTDPPVAAAPAREAAPATAAPLVSSTPSVTAAAPITASTTAQSTRVEPAFGARSMNRNNTQLALGLLVIAGLCALIGWRLQSWATRAPAAPAVEQPGEPPSPASTAAREDMSRESSTLARVAPPEAPPAAAAVADEAPTAESEDEVILDDEDPGEGALEQLSAAEFRKVLLRTNRSQRVRACYDRHGPGDVEIVALVGRGGKVLKLRTDSGPLADCLRKVVLRLEFPRASRQAQHNYVFHPPPSE